MPDFVGDEGDRFSKIPLKALLFKTNHGHMWVIWQTELVWSFFLAFQFESLLTDL